MPNITYKKFYTWISQDDYIVWEWQYIDGENVDGLETGYWITLAKDRNKGILTSMYPMYGMWGVLTWTWTSNKAYVWSDWVEWFIYKLNGVDNTPSHTITSGDTSYLECRDIFYYNSNYYIIAMWPWVESYAIHKISLSNWATDTWSWFTYDDTTASNKFTPPVLFKDGLVYMGYSGWVIEYDWTTYTTTSLVEWNVVWLTSHWSTIKIYTDIWQVWYWDGTTWASAAVNAAQQVWFSIAKVQQVWNIDYITSTDWDLYISSGYTFQLISRKQESNRLEDNTASTNKMAFIQNTDDADGNLLTFWRSDIYMVNNGKSLYKYGELMNWLTKWFHNILNTNNTDVTLDRIYTIKYLPGLKRVYYTYKTGSIYGADYLDLDSELKASDGHIITNIFTWWTTLKKEIREIRLTTSNTSWNNNIKLYTRIDNWTWTLIETINEATDVITRTETYADVSQFIDIQFKIELHNEAWADAPILHELQLNYDIVEN